MIEALSTPPNRIKTLILVVICSLFTITAVSLGIDDNPPGILLALLAAIAFVLAFVHPWRTSRKFIILLLASVIGFVLFVVLNILLDTVAQNPSTSAEIRALVQSPTSNALFVILAMLFAAALLVGSIGSVVMFIRSRQQTT